jgi:spermidine synthase
LSVSDLEILAYEPSALGMLCLRRRGMRSTPDAVVTEITLDHQFLMSSHNTASERALARFGLEMHEGKALRVLIGGLGLGVTAQEALLSDRVARVEVVEFLPPVIDWLDRGLLPLGAELRADARFAVSQGDVYRRLASTPEERHDLILVDVDHSPDEPLGSESAAFYTEAGLALARRHLADDGVLGVWSYAESPNFAATLRRVFREVRVEPLHFENPVLLDEETNWLFFARG